MGYNNNDQGDWEKLQLAVQGLTSQFGSVDDAMAAFGLRDLPMAQRYGILFGCLTFVCTVGAVVLLLVWGGTFRRIQEQATTGHATLQSPTEARQQRALLLEELLTNRKWMMERNYSKDNSSITNTDKKQRKETTTPLTTMLCQVEPPTKKQSTQSKTYEEHYKLAYRACQDAPGGAVLPGRPEARYEAYARAYAGCCGLPPDTTTYRRSYARLYEATACQSLKSDDIYTDRFLKHSQDIVGRHVRLQALDATQHAQSVYQLTSGEPTTQRGGTKAFDPAEVWAFWPQGPFASPKELKESFVFTRKEREAAFCIFHNVTDEVLGVILMNQDEPEHLRIQMNPLIAAPQLQGTILELEASFLLLDRLLLGVGYRRVQVSLDCHDAVNRKWATRLGFTLEGVLHRHEIVRDSSRDSALYALTNADWKHGARAALFRKLYGAAAWRADQNNESKEAEREAQDWNLSPTKTTTAPQQK